MTHAEARVLCDENKADEIDPIVRSRLRRENEELLLLLRTGVAAAEKRGVLQ